MYRHTIKLSLIALLSTLLTVHAIAQMNYWTIGSNKINMTTATPTQTTLPGGTTTDFESNGAYDYLSGNLLFYVSRWDILGPTGLVVGTLKSTNCPETGLNGPDVIIVPIPGTCRQFYVIYGKADPASVSHVLYVKVDCSGASPVVTYNLVLTTCGSSTPVGFDTGLLGFDTHAAFAVSKPIGTGGTAKRFLYCIRYDGIYKAEITSTGIGTTSLVVLNTTLVIPDFMETMEVDLSWGGNYLAWTSKEASGTDKNVHYIQLNASTGAYISASINNVRVAAAKGIEFTNETGSFNRLYITGTGGLYQWLFGGSTASALTTTGYDLSHSFLQYAKNGKIYGISPTYTTGTLTGTTLVGITPIVNTITSYNPGLIDTYYDAASIVASFSLPRQVNGEDYTYFFGVANSVPGFTINGTNAVTGTSCTGSPGVLATYGCTAVPLTMANLSTNAVSYNVALYSYATCGGTQTLVYNSGYLATFPTNLKALPGTNGNWLNNSHYGLFRVVLSTKNTCGDIATATGYINVASDPSAPAAAFTINGTNAASTLCTSPLVTFGCPAYLITLANTTTGAITYNIDLYSYSVCGTNTLVNSTGYVSTFPTNLKALPGANGTWLTSHTGNFKVVLTAKNICGTTGTATGYINVAGAPTGASIGLKTTASVKASQTITIAGCTITTGVSPQTINYDDIASPSCGGTGGYVIPVEHTSAANAQPVGQNNTSFLFTATGGLGSFTYSVLATTEQWNSGTSTWVNKNYLGAPENLGIGATSVNLNSLLADDPAFSYDPAFLDPARTPEGSIYKITFTVQNECGTSPPVSQVIKINRTQLRNLIIDPTADEPTAINTDNAVMVYPNPIGNKVNFNITAKANDVINISLHDIQGRKVADVKTNVNAIDGENLMNADVSGLKPGMYFYRITINNTTYSGKLIKE